jgi:hypothetical protein
LITSTSFITGTGLKKCIPMTRSPAPLCADSAAAAIDVMLIELVFVART